MVRDVKPAPSGEQYEISHGDQHATVVEVGGGVRAYRVGDRDVLHPYDVDAICDGAHGAPLVPWPNRIRDGRYTFDGAEYRVTLTEPDKSNAIHGFLSMLLLLLQNEKPTHLAVAFDMSRQSFRTREYAEYCEAFRSRSR